LIKTSGSISLIFRGSDGRIKSRRVVKNLIVNLGKYEITKHLNQSESGSQPYYIGIGTDATPPAVGQTALLAEIGTRQAIPSPTRNNNVVTYPSAAFGPGNGTGTITEAGLFFAVTAGLMFCRATFTGIPKGAGDSLTVTWTVTVG